MFQNLIFGILFFFWKYDFGFGNITFYIRPHVSVDIARFFCEFFIFQQKFSKATKRSLILQYSFAQKTSLILRASTHLILKIICSRNTAKNLSHITHIFQPTFFCLMSEKIFALHQFFMPKNCIFLKLFKSKCLYISVYLRKKFLFQRRSRILSGLERLKNFLKDVSLFELVKNFYNFSF